MKRNNIRIAIQKEGRLKNRSLKLLESFGLEFSKELDRTLIIPCKNADVEILYVRHRDIPQYVQSEAADFGIVGDNVLYETNFNVTEIKKLDFGQCSLIIAVPVSSSIKNIQELEGERIATSYPNSLRKFLRKQNLNAAIIEIKGAVEATPALGLADAICDLTQTGSSLKENDLRPIATLFNSTAVLIESPSERNEKKDFIERFLTPNL
jgi:ATP phosphoribosyltransferase